MSIAFVPGSFDPMHLGHLDVIDQALEVFGAVVVGVLHNPSKPSGLFTPEERVALAEQTVGDRQNVTVGAFSGLAVQAAAAAGALPEPAGRGRRRRHAGRRDGPGAAP